MKIKTTNLYQPYSIRIKKNLSLLCFTILMSSIAFSQTIVERAGRLQVTGNQITTEDGQAISLAGNSMFWSNAGESEPFYNAETVNHLADDWNSTIIRAALGVKETWDGGNNYIDNPQGQKQKIKRVIDAAIDKGVYVIIDWHTHQAEDYPNEAAEFFGEMAQQYGNYDNVIYEIYNEPLIDTPWETVKNYAVPVIAAIRANDPDNLIVVGTRTWCQEVVEASQNPITGDPNLGYVFHFYADSHLLGNGFGSNIQTAMNNGIAIMVTEFGTTDFTGNAGFNSVESNRWFDFMEDKGISYVNWNVSDKSEGSSIVSGGAGLSGLLNQNLTESGAFIRDHMRNKNYDNITLSSNNNFDLDDNTLTLYPNPVNDILKVKSISSIDNISIYDITGRLVLSSHPKENTYEVVLNLKSFESGNYILQLESASNKSVARKIIKL